MWEPLQRYRALDRESRRIFRRAAVLLPWIRVSLRFRGYNPTFSALQNHLGFPPATPVAGREHAQRVTRMVQAAVRYSLWRFTCLEESLCLWYLLRELGIASQLRIGVRKTQGKFEAHAWVECGGEAVNQPEAAHVHYAAFDKEFSEPPGDLS